MTFIEESIQHSWDIWQQYVEQPFLKDIRRDKLDPAVFHHYLVEDTIYLMEYARCIAIGIYKSKTMEEMRLFYDMLKFVESDENVARVKLLAMMGTDVKDIENKEPTIENRAYTSFLLQTAKEEGILEILFAILPCMLSYAFIGKELMRENPRIVAEHSYAPWIHEYVADEYIEKCKKWASQADEFCKGYPQEKQEHLKKIFREASVHELNFWKMSYQKQEERKC